jgi:hypothetical protein
MRAARGLATETEEVEIGWLTTQSGANRSAPKFPGYREFTGKISPFWTDAHETRPNQRARSEPYERFPCFVEQGTQWAGSGNGYRGISEPGAMIRSACPTGRTDRRDPRPPRRRLHSPSRANLRFGSAASRSRRSGITSGVDPRPSDAGGEGSMGRAGRAQS